ncbi:MAG: glycosyltransferase [Sulfuricella sp.]|nr:glycosyltransferase [Sulfuricella sp.]
MSDLPEIQADAPLFSICLPTFDRNELLRQTLDSILSQTFGSFEVIIGNNNPDGALTQEILGVNDARVRIINHPTNLGQLANLNYLLTFVRGRYVTCIADDDFYAPDFFEAVNDAVTKHDFPPCVFTAYDLHYGLARPNLKKTFSGETSLYSGAEFLRKYLLGEIKAIGIMGMFDIDFLKGIGGIEDVSADGMGIYVEYMLLIRAGLLEKVVHISDPLMYYRIHEGAWGVANTDLERYFRAGENLVLRSAELLSGESGGDHFPTLLLIFNLTLKQLLYKTGSQNLSIDVRLMLHKLNEALITNSSATGIAPLQAGIDIIGLLLQQFADAETGRIFKEGEIRTLKADCNTKDKEISSLKADCDTKDAEINSLKSAYDKDTRFLQGICEEREKVIFQLDERVRFLERTNLIGKVLVKVRSLFLGVMASTKAWLGPLFYPRMGVLRQYPPRELVLPTHYQSARAAEPLPSISIVTPSYNQAVFLERTIQSVKDQGYENLEYIVQDGGSSDASVDVLERFGGFLTHWQSGKDNGQTHAINLGFAHAHGEIMAYLNSDDILLPGVLHYVADFFSRNSDVDVVYGHRILIDENDWEIGRWVLPPHDDQVLSWADFIPQETLFWRRRVWEEIGGSLDESFHFAMDWDLLLRLRDAGAKFVRLPRFIAAFRVHSQQKTSVEIGDVGFKEMTRLRERCHGRPVSDVEIRRAVAPYMLRHVFYDKLQRFFPS